MPLFEFKNRETGEVREIQSSPDLDNFKDDPGGVDQARLLQAGASRVAQRVQ